MRYLTILLLLGVTLKVNAQQINPVPDYVFRYQMSVGRNAATDSLAYFSIGPKYGANKGFMPPMVVDTATVTGAAKRNGLTIFSIQRNKYLYWDSVRVQWSDFAGSSGAYIFASDTTAMLAPYVRIAGIGLTKGTQTLSVDTNTISTRAWRQKGLDSLAALELSLADTATMLSPYVRAAGFGLTKSGQSLLADSATMATRARVQKGIDSVAGLSRVTGSGTTNTIPKWTSSTALGNSGVTDQSTVNILQLTSSNTMWYKGASTTANAEAAIENDNTAFYLYPSLSGAVSKELRFYFNGSSSGERIRIFNNGRVFIGPTPVDVGTHQLQVAGSIYNTAGAVFAATSGNVGIGTTSPAAKLDITGADPGDQMAIRNWPMMSVSGPTLRYGGYNASQWTRLTFHNQGSERMRIDTGGLVGIGVVVPTERLHVNGRARIATIDSSASPINMLWADANGVIQKSAPAIQGSGTNLRMAQFTGTSTVGNSNMYITSGGNGYGLNTSNIISFTDYGTLNLNGNVGAIYYFKLADTVRGLFGMAASTIGGLLSQSTLEINNTTDGPIVFSTNGNTRARITSAGEMLIGTASDAGNYLLQVNGNAYLQNGQMFFNQVTDKSAIFVSQYSVTGSASSNMIGASATWNTTGNPNLINIDLTNTASGATANYINISDGTNTFRVNKSAEIFTSAPTGGSSKGWRLGEVATVTPTSPNRTIRVEIDGVVYYIHAKTTND